MILASLLFLKGMKIGKGPEAAAMTSPALEVYFNGPLKAIFEALTDIKGRMLVVRLETKEDFAVLLSQTRHNLANSMVQVQEDINDNLENRFRDTNSNVNSIHSRLDDVMKSLARLEANNNPPPRRGRQG